MFTGLIFAIFGQIRENMTPQKFVSDRFAKINPREIFHFFTFDSGNIKNFVSFVWTA